MGRNNCKAMKGVILGVLCLMLSVEKSGAYQFVVGGQKGWNVPSDPNFNPYNSWAEKRRFQIGDSLGKFLHTLFFIYLMKIILFFRLIV